MHRMSIQTSKKKKLHIQNYEEFMKEKEKKIDFHSISLKQY